MMASTHLDQTMMALADSTRRAILQRLSKGEARVTDIARPFDMSLNAVSKHILVLERANLVRRRIEGRDHYLSANAGPLNEAVDWIENYRRLWEERLNRLDAYLEEMQSNKNTKQSKEKNDGRKK